MAQSSWQLTDTFAAVGPDGSAYTIHEYTEIHVTQTIHDTAPTRHPGMKAYRLANGEPLNFLGNGEFEIARTGVRLKRKA